MKSSLLTRLSDQPDALNHLPAGLSEDQIRRRTPTRKWSIFEDMTHLGLYQAVFLDRTQQIIADETPRFSRYPADDDPAFTDWVSLSFQTLTERIRGERAVLSAFLSMLHEE